MDCDCPQMVQYLMLLDTVRCRYWIKNVEAERAALVGVFADRKRRRRLLDPPRPLVPRAGCADRAASIWAQRDVHFAEELRLSRMQFTHIEHAVSAHLAAPTGSSGRSHVLSRRGQLMMFISHLAHGACMSCPELPSCALDSPGSWGVLPPLAPPPLAPPPLLRDDTPKACI